MKQLNWKPPRQARSYFHREADAEFRKKHPCGYRALTFLGIFLFLLPLLAITILSMVLPTHNDGFVVPAGLGAMIMGIGLFNLAAIPIGQYLGHWLTLGCLLLGGAMTGGSCWFLFWSELRLDEQRLRIYFVALLILLLPPIFYMVLRSDLDSWLRDRGMRKGDIRRLKTGASGFWWYTGLRQELGGFYWGNKLVTVLYPVLLLTALTLGWNRWMAAAVAAGHMLLTLCLVGMLICVRILPAGSGRHRSRRLSLSNFLMLIFPLIVAGAHLAAALRGLA